MNMMLMHLMLLCVTAYSFSAGGRFRSSQIRKFRVAAVQPNAVLTSINDPRLLDNIPKSKRAAEENDKDEEEAVDEYLEFLDRRYRRLHEKETKGAATSIKAPFSALSWLTQEQVTDSIIAEQIQDDALYVLGVAGLASKRLLHKHHIPESYIKPLGRPMVQDAIEVSSKMADDESSIASQRKAFGMGQTVERVTKFRQTLINFQSRKGVFVLKALLGAPYALTTKIWAIGGGKRSLAIAVTIASVLTIALIRPLLMTIGKESLTIVGSR